MQHILRLEESLLDPKIRRSPDKLKQLLASELSFALVQRAISRNCTSEKATTVLGFFFDGDTTTRTNPAEK